MNYTSGCKSLRTCFRAISSGVLNREFNSGIDCREQVKSFFFGRNALYHRIPGTSNLIGQGSETGISSNTYYPSNETGVVGVEEKIQKSSKSKKTGDERSVHYPMVVRYAQCLENHLFQVNANDFAWENIRAFKEWGASDSVIIRLFRENPDLSRVDRVDNIRSLHHCLSQNGMESDAIVKVAFQFPAVLSLHISRIESVISVLKPITGSAFVNRVITRYPAILGYKPSIFATKPYIRPLAIFFRHEPRLLVLDSGQSPAGIALNILFNKKQINFSHVAEMVETFEYMVSFFGEKNSISMIRKSSSIARISKVSLEQKIIYLVEKWGRSIDEIIFFPKILDYSVEGKLQPRFEALKALGLDKSVPLSSFIVNDTKFAEYLSKRVKRSS